MSRSTLGAGRSSVGSCSKANLSTSLMPKPIPTPSWRTDLGPGTCVRYSAYHYCAKERPSESLLLQRSVVLPFTDKEIELAETFADQAVIAIENVRLFDEVQARTRDLSESLEQQTATSEVLKVISGSPGELEPVFQAMLANATRICEATFGNLFLRDGPTLRAVAVHGKKTYADLGNATR